MPVAGLQGAGEEFLFEEVVGTARVVSRREQALPVHSRRLRQQIQLSGNASSIPCRSYKSILFCIHLATKESSKLFLPTVRTRIGEIFKEKFGRFVLTSSFPIETETCLCIRANNR